MSELNDLGFLKQLRRAGRRFDTKFLRNKLPPGVYARGSQVARAVRSATPHRVINKASQGIRRKVGLGDLDGTLMDHEENLMVRGLEGLDDFEGLDAWTRRLTGEFAQRLPPGVAPQATAKAMQQRLGVPAKTAAIAVNSALRQRSSVTPRDVTTEAGAQRIAVAGKRAEAATRLHHKRARALEKSSAKLQKRLRNVKAGPLRAKLELDLGVLTRELLAERTQASRAATVGGATLTALKFRQEARREKDPNKRKQLLGQAAAAIDVGMVVARTKVKVELPQGLRRSDLRAKARQAGMPVPEPIPQASASMPSSFTTTSEPTVVMALAGLDDLGAFDFGALASTVGNFASSLFPANSTVGRVLSGATSAVSAASSGNWSGAASAALATASRFITRAPPMSAQTTAPNFRPALPPPLPAPQQQVFDRIAQSTAQVAPPGMTSPMRTGIPGWVIPAAAAGVGALVLIAFIL